MKFELLSIVTDRFSEMKQFYVDVLGFEVTTEHERFVEFVGQGVRFAICDRQELVDAVSADQFGEPATGRPLSLAFRCATKESLASDLARLVEKGAVLVKEPSTMPWGQFTAFFADPDGHVHELFVDVTR